MKTKKMKGIVCGRGINDMEKNWIKKDKWNEMVYNKWHSMMVRCYSEKYQERFPTYKNCTVCNDWLLLSKFVEDFKKINGYNEKNFLNGELELDKDIKSNGTNKEYSLENCMLVSKSENVSQSNKTREYPKGENNHMYNKNHSNITKEKISKVRKEKEIASGKNNPKAKRVAQYDLNGNLIKIWDYIKQISNEMSEINYGGLGSVLQGKTKTSIYKGYIWKYYNDGDENDG